MKRADSISNPWPEYERRKREIVSQNLSAQEYEREIKKLCDELNI